MGDLSGPGRHHRLINLFIMACKRFSVALFRHPFEAEYSDIQQPCSPPTSCSMSLSVRSSRFMSWEFDPSDVLAILFMMSALLRHVSLDNALVSLGVSGVIL